MDNSTLPREKKGGTPIPVFTTRRVDSVTSGVAWIPQPYDSVFSSPAAFTGVVYVTEAGTQTSVSLAANLPRGLEGVKSITFNADGVIEVM